MSTENKKVTPLIEIKNCVMEFPGVKALDQVNFTLMPGECHALVGENGAGKSTLSKCITGENQMTSGELRVKGELIKIPSYNVRESQKSDCSSGVYSDGRYDGSGKYFCRTLFEKKWTY